MFFNWNVFVQLMFLFSILSLGIAILFLFRDYL